MKPFCCLIIIFFLALPAAAQLPEELETRMEKLGFQSEYWATYIRMARLHNREDEIEMIIDSRITFLLTLRKSCPSFQRDDIARYLYYSDLGLSAESLARVLNAKGSSPELLQALNGFLSVAAGYLHADKEELEALTEAFAIRNYSPGDLSLLTGVLKTLHGKDFGMKSGLRKQKLMALFRDGYSISFIKRQLEDLS